MKISTVLLAVFLMLAVGPAFAKAVNCPAHLKTGGASHALDSASVFDGPPEEMADLVPDDDSADPQQWTLGDIRENGRNFYLVCRYADTDAVKMIRIPAKAKTCTQSLQEPIKASCQ